MRGTRTFFSTGTNCGESPRCPAVITIDMGSLALLDGQVQLGGEPAARAPQPVITGLSEDTARRFFLQVALPSSPGRMAVLFVVGRKRLKTVSTKPERTVETLKEDARWARNPTS